MAELWLFISAPPIGPRSNSSISPTHCPLKMCDMDSIPLAEHYWLAAIPLLINISVAILSTKIPILLGHDFMCFHVAKLARYGFWSMASEARTDFSMLLGLLFLLIVGAGRYSLDACLFRKLKEESHE